MPLTAEQNKKFKKYWTEIKSIRDYCTCLADDERLRVHVFIENIKYACKILHCIEGNKELLKEVVYNDIIALLESLPPYVSISR